MITLGDSLKNIFQDAISCQEPSGLVMEFNVYRTDPRFRYFAFVEAADDAKFYSNSNVDRLKNSYCKFISAGQNVSDLYKGKKAVLDALKRISEDKVLSPEVKKCMFIVDRDYDDSLKHTGVKLSAEQRHNIKITQGYSFENYYFQKQNIDTIFSYLKYSEDKQQKILGEMQSFFLQYTDYFAAKGIVSMNYEFTRNSLPVIPEHEQIFKYDFKNGVLVDEKKYKKAKNILLSYLQKNTLLWKEYGKLRARLAADPLCYLRGHDVYNYFYNYLQYQGEDVVKSDLLKLCKKMNVQLENVVLR